jgi:hypothetical protein
MVDGVATPMAGCCCDETCCSEHPCENCGGCTPDSYSATWSEVIVSSDCFNYLGNNYNFEVDGEGPGGTWADTACVPQVPDTCLWQTNVDTLTEVQVESCPDGTVLAEAPFGISIFRTPTKILIMVWCSIGGDPVMVFYAEIEVAEEDPCDLEYENIENWLTEDDLGTTYTVDETFGISPLVVGYGGTLLSFTPCCDVEAPPP